MALFSLSVMAVILAQRPGSRLRVAGRAEWYDPFLVLLAAATALLLAAPAAAPAAAERSPIPPMRVETNGPPPAPLADPRGAALASGAIWIDGYWQWTGGKWAWIFGEWTVPPCRPACAWVPPRWEGDDRGWTFHEPYWRPTSGSPRDIREPPFVPHTSASRPPPPLLVEVPRQPPSREAVWIPGFWAWTGTRHAWVSGGWSAPYPGHRWVEGYWKRDGGRFNWVPGRWKRI
jgi:hypothetical protein